VMGAMSAVLVSVPAAIGRTTAVMTRLAPGASADAGTH
jgi:hypothetical protein